MTTQTTTPKSSGKDAASRLACEHTFETIGGIVAARPHSAQVFESLGIDYCCGGRRPLVEVCQEKKLDLAEVERLLAAPPRTVEDEAGPDWTRESLTRLVEHILEAHHVYTKAAIQRLRPLMSKVHDAHAKNHPELSRLRQVIGSLFSELEGHLMKEEHILFPYILGLDAGGGAPEACFGTVAGPINVMRMEHDDAGDALRQMRDLTREYTVPEGACGSYRALYHGLEELERDLHRHIHLENNILFPRAVAVEASA